MPVVRLMKPSVQDNSDVKSTVKLMPTVKCQLTEVQVVASSRVQTVHHLPSPIRLRRFTCVHQKQGFISLFMHTHAHLYLGPDNFLCD